MLGPLIDASLFALGAGLLVAAVRRWRCGLRWRVGICYAVLACGFVGPALLTPRPGIGTDIAATWLPWKQPLASSAQAPSSLSQRPQNPLLIDPLLQMLPFRTLVRQRLLAGRAPLWASELGTGQPLLGNGQSAPFAPLHLLALPLPPLRALTVAAGWQLLLAALLAHCLAAGLGAGERGSVLCALVFGFGLYQAVWLYFPLGMTAAWAPGIFLGLVLLRRREAGGAIGLVVCSLGAALSGHPETLGHLALASAVVCIFLASRAPRSQSLRFLGAAALTAILAFGLAAPALLPILEALPESLRQASIQETGFAPSPPAFEPGLAGLLVHPFHFGSPRDHNWSGPTNFNETSSAYVGLLPLALAIVGGFLPGRRWLWLGALGALAAAWGLSPAVDLADSVPLLEKAAHHRLRFLWALGAALVAAQTWSEVSSRRRLQLSLVGVALALGLLAWFLRPPQASLWQNVWLASTLLGVSAVVLTLLISRARRVFPIVLPVAVASDLFLAGARYQPAPPTRFDLQPPPPAVARLQLETRREPEPTRVAAVGRSLLPNLAACYGLWDLRSNDPMHPARPIKLLGSRLGASGLLKRQSLRDPALLSYLGVGYMLTPHRVRLEPPWQHLEQFPGGRVWSNPQRRSLFFVPRTYELVQGVDQSLDRALHLQDPTLHAVVEGQAGAIRADQKGAVTGIEAEPNGFSIRTSADSWIVIASSVSDARGWRILSGPGSLLRINGAFVGVLAPPGEQTIRLGFRPRGWRIGWTLACLSLLGVGVARLRMHRGGAGRALLRW